MNVVIVCRKEISDAEEFDQLIHNIEARLQGAGLDSIKSKLVYDPDQIKDGDRAFTTPGD